MYRYMHTARTVSSSIGVSVRPPRRTTTRMSSERYQLDHSTWHNRLQGVNGAGPSGAVTSEAPVSLPMPAGSEQAAA